MRKILFIITLFMLVYFSLFSQLSEIDRETISTYLESAKVHETKGEYAMSADLYSKIAYLQWNANNNNEALKYFFKASEQNQNIGNTNALRTIYTNIGMLYSDENKYEDALNYFKKSLQINKQLGRKSDAASNLLNIGVTLSSLSKSQEAITYLELGLEVALETGDMRLIKNCYNLLAENYQAIGKAEKAYEYFDKYASIEKMLKQKEIESIEVQKQQAEAGRRQTEQEKSLTESTLRTTEESLKKVEKVSYEKQTQIELLVKDKKLKELAIKEQQTRLQHARLMIIFSIGGIGLVLFVVVILFRSYRLKKRSNEKLAAKNEEILKQQEIIEKKNTNITHSLNYAKRIQQAILPPQANIQQLIPDSFIFFKPRDIVSGDFFFFSNLDDNNGTATRNSILIHDIDKKIAGNTNKVIISAIDCTGHGVPGAFMSLIGHNLLIEIIAQGITEPHEILNMMHLGIKSSLNQGTTENRDGMDMALCILDKVNKKLHYAGAKNPLVYIQDNELFQIKADLYPIGGIETEEKRMFTKHTIDVSKSTTCYLFSDGFQDQIGGEEGKKYLSKNFKEFLLSIHNLPLELQKEALDKELIRWIGEQYHQVDDILVIGFKI